jgi:hypothetical protein
MTMIEYLSAFLTGFGWGMAAMFGMGLATLGGFMDSYREHLNKKIESGND